MGGRWERKKGDQLLLCVLCVTVGELLLTTFTLDFHLIPIVTAVTADTTEHHTTTLIPPTRVAQRTDSIPAKQRHFRSIALFHRCMNIGLLSLQFYLGPTPDEQPAHSKQTKTSERNPFPESGAESARETKPNAIGQIAAHLGHAFFSSAPYVHITLSSVL